MKQQDTLHSAGEPIPEHHKHRDEFYGAQPFDYEHNPSWRIFRIMAEFVDGFHFISRFKKTVTFFGSARFKDNNPHYKVAQKTAHLLSKNGYTIISGGGPGIMEAANKGASEAKGESVGLNIMLPFEQRINPYVKKSMAFNYFFTRKVMLAFSAQAYIFFPGGYGTLDELFEIITLRETHKINPKTPIILVGKDYWMPLYEWIKSSLYKQHKTINQEELELVEVVDSPDEVLKIIKKVKF